MHLEIYAPLGAQFRAMREQRKLTQAEVGEMLGIKQAAVSAYERGVRNLTIKKIVQFAHALSCDVQISLLPFENQSV